MSADQKISTEMLENAVSQCGNSFDTHEVIRILMKDNPHAYVNHLSKLMHTEDPILQGNALIGRKLKNDCDVLSIMKDEKVNSPNLRNQDETMNQGWKKL